MNHKKLLSTLLVCALAVCTLFTLAGCQPADDGKYSVGIIQLAEHSALDDATRGFQDALTEKLGENVTFDLKNAQGEQTNCTTIVSGFVSQKVDLIMANATNAVKAAREATDTIPIVGTSVTDYAGSGLVASNEAPGANVTGASDNNPVTVQVELMQKLCPDAKTIGIVICSGEENSAIQAEEAKAAFEAVGYTVNIYTVADSNEIAPVVTQACTEVDAFYEPSDNLISSNVSAMSNITNANGKPVITSVESMVNDGFLAAYSISYYDLGYQAGLMAHDILVNDANPAEMPIYFFNTDNLTLITNEETAAQLGISLEAAQ